MKKILLVCNAGMSTSLLVSNMQKYAKSEQLDVEILAVPLSQAESMIKDWDIVMLGPQVRHTLSMLEKKANNIPILVIDMRDYGLMKGENVVKAALAELNK